MPRWMIMIGLCLSLSGPAMAQVAEDAQEPNEPAAPVEAVDAEEAPAVDPTDVSALTWEQAWDGGFALYRAGSYDDAIVYLERALDLGPADPTVRAYLADCYGRTGDAARAAELSAPLQAEETVEQASSDEQPAHSIIHRGAYAPSCPRPHGGQGEDGPLNRTVREGKHFGMGLSLGGNALSAGVYFEGLPVRFLAIQGGLGLGDVHTFFWWLQAAVLPLDMPLAPSVGVGVLGTMGLDFRYQSNAYYGSLDYYMNRVNPYVHVGVVLVTRPGFTAAFDLNGVFTGDPSFPLAPWIGLRIGFLL